MLKSTTIENVCSNKQDHRKGFKVLSGENEIISYFKPEKVLSRSIKYS